MHGDLLVLDATLYCSLKDKHPRVADRVAGQRPAMPLNVPLCTPGGRVRWQARVAADELLNASPQHWELQGSCTSLEQKNWLDQCSVRLGLFD
jgi:hypothetical protein